MSLPVPSEPSGREATRRRILDVALDLFGRYGFEGTSVKAIGQQCGLTDGALYYYFRSKREILDALWDTAEARVLGEPPPDEHLTVERLMQLVDLMFDAAAERDMLLRVMIRQVLAEDRVAIELRNQTMAYWKQYLARQFETCLPRDEARRHADALALLILGTTLTAQIDHGERFAEVARSDEFRGEVRALVGVTLPLCRCGEGGSECERSFSA